MALLDNAVKFTEKGFIRVSYKEDNPRHMLCLMIEDSGIGINQEDTEHIFEHFLK
ncbi:MAG: ATP-binding protein [Bacteroides sp.]|nr:ATP-binding protein [Bacteroides sp.]